MTLFPCPGSKIMPGGTEGDSRFGEELGGQPIEIPVIDTFDFFRQILMGALPGNCHSGHAGQIDKKTHAFLFISTLIDMSCADHAECSVHRVRRVGILSASIGIRNHRK